MGGGSIFGVSNNFGREFGVELQCKKTGFCL
jgi:hypothetical protein